MFYYKKQFIKSFKKNSSPLDCRWIFLLMIIGTSSAFYTQVKIDSVDILMKTEPKFIIVNISSKGCIYCMMQEKKIKKDKLLQQNLASQVYSISIMAEHSNSFKFDSTNFKNMETFIDKYGKDKFGYLAYPLWIIFDKQYQPIYRYYGLLKNEEIEKLLQILSNDKK